MKQKYTANLILVIALSIIILSCSQQKTKWQGTIEELDGVIVVKNPAEPLYGEDALELEEDLSIGEAQGREEYMFSGINDIDVDDYGNIYVVEGTFAHIRIFDGNGKFLRTIGRKGQGPGEFQMPIYVQVNSQNEIMVYDHMAQRLSFFSRDGMFLNQMTTTITGNPFIPIKIDSQGNLIVMISLAPPPIGGKLLKLYNSNLEFQMTIAREERGRRGIFDIGKPTWHCDVSPNDKIVWGDSSEYVLQVLNNEGKLTKKIYKDYNPIEIASEDKKRYEKEYAERVKMGFKIHFRNHFPAFSDLFVNDEDRIFVKTYERIEDSNEHFYFDIFDPEGKYLAKVPLKASLTRFSIWKKNKLHTIEEDDEGYQVIKRYKVTWNY